MDELNLDQSNAVKGLDKPSVDSALSILVNECGALNIDPNQDTLLSLSDTVGQALADPDSATEPATLKRCRDLLCSVLFDLESLGLTPMTELPLSELQSHLLTLTFDTSTKNEPLQSAEVSKVSVEPESQQEFPFLSERAQALWKMGQRFAAWSNTAEPPLAGEHCERLAEIHWMAGIELEYGARLQSCLIRVWPNKDALIKPMLSSSSGKITLAKEQAERIRAFETVHAGSLPEGRLSTGVIAASLRLLLAKKSLPYYPALIELATLLLLFPEMFPELPEPDRAQLTLSMLSLHRAKQLAVDFAETKIPGLAIVLEQANTALDGLNRFPAS